MYALDYCQKCRLGECDTCLLLSAINKIGQLTKQEMKEFLILTCPSNYKGISMETIPTYLSKRRIQNPFFAGLKEIKIPFEEDKQAITYIDGETQQYILTTLEKDDEEDNGDICTDILRNKELYEMLMDYDCFISKNIKCSSIQGEAKKLGKSMYEDIDSEELSKEHIAHLKDLLGVAAEREKQKNIKEKRRAVEKLFKQLDEEIQRKRKRLIKADTPNEQTVEYESLIDGKQMWDREVIYFGDYNQDKVLSQYLFELEKLESYVKHNDYHENYFSYEKFMSISEKMRSNALLALLLLQKDSLSIDDIDIYYQNLIFLKQQQEKIDLQEYSSVNFSKVCNIIGVSEDENLLSAIDVLSNISRNQSELQKAVNNVLQIRENLHNNHSQILENGVCPYCGHDWNTSKELETQFVSTKNILYNLLAQDGELYAKQLEIVKSQIDEKIIDVLKCKITELSNNDILMVYSEFDSKAKFANALESARPLYNICFNSMVDSGFSAEDVNEYWVQLLEMCLNIGNSIPAEYLAANMKYSFAEIRKKYALDLLDASKLSKEKFALKRQYLQEQFYRSFDKLKEEIHNLETKKDTIEVIKSQLKEYENALGNSIEAYKKQIIDEIEIPFFVYSSRLLQSYQGGQGVLLKNDGESIRFTSPGNEHDVLYTMSSGQLSAVLLSFSLALNKIYSGRGIKTILIDDPIQCMDDINMISFVELLRREFSECQIILSTHEESFSNFVRYKFKKYGLNTQVITLKDA